MFERSGYREATSTAVSFFKGIFGLPASSWKFEPKPPLTIYSEKKNTLGILGGKSLKIHSCLSRRFDVGSSNHTPKHHEFTSSRYTQMPIGIASHCSLGKERALEEGKDRDMQHIFRYSNFWPDELNNFRTINFGHFFYLISSWELNGYLCPTSPMKIAVLKGAY